VKNTHTQILKLWRLLNIKIFAPNILSANIHSHQAMHLGQSGVVIENLGNLLQTPRNNTN